VPRAKKNPLPPGVVKISRLSALSGVPASTIKHYVRLGLLPPPLTRPNKQMAYYDEGLVDRIKAIKILQSERFLPLPSIKRILGDPPRPGESRGEAVRAQNLAALEPALKPPPSGWLSKKQLLAGFQLSERDLATLTAAGLVATSDDEDGEPGFGDTDLDILRVIHETRAAGLEKLFPMDVLAPYVDAVRRLVKLEIDLFRGRMQAGVELPEGMGVEQVAHLAGRLGERLVVALRRQLTLGELRLLGASAGKPRASTSKKKPAARPAAGARSKRT
jgi:DNA-binding transcriptional MerR regulator